MPLLIVLALFMVSCSMSQSPESVVEQDQIQVSVSPSLVPTTVSQPLFLDDGDLSNAEKLVIQVNRATQANKDAASALLQKGQEVAEEDARNGILGGSSGRSKMFCGSAIEYPTIEALMGCAESTALSGSSLEDKISNFRASLGIYRATLEFSKLTNSSISKVDRQEIEDNLNCLDTFVKSPNIASPGCELVKNSLGKL